MAVELETRVAVLERDITQMIGFFEKLDSTMEKLAEVSSSIKELLAVHELKLQQQDTASNELYTLIENRRVDSEKQHQLIQNKIVESEKELQRDMDKFQKSILDEMKELRKELKSYHDEAATTRTILDRYKWGFLIIGVLLAFLLYKAGVIPFMPPFLG
jgi:DNA repair exonuclease SbcCD ATPase subunit